MAPLEGFVLERRGCPLHVWTGGPAGRPLVVFTHGACVDHRSFEAQVAAVARDYRVLTWDVRGHGRSQPVGEPFTVPLAVEDLLAVLDHLGHSRAVFVGHSNGSYIAQELAFRHPERVQALVLLDGTCITWPRSALELWLLRVSPRIMRLLPYETLKRASLPFISARADVRAYVYEAFSSLTKPQFIALWNGAITCLHEEPDYRITQPLLLAHGDDDRTGDIMKIAPRWAAQTPNCQYEVIPNARHMAMMDNPDFVNERLMAFLAKWCR